MKRSRRSSLSSRLAAFVLASACFAAAASAQVSPPAGQPGAGQAGASATQGPSKVCLDVQTDDSVTKEFADRLREAIAASGALSLASTADSCNLQLHVPGNLLRFQTAGGVMISTVVIVTSASGHYLSTSITACQASDLKPCAVRAISAAKLALLVTANDGS